MSLPSDLCWKKLLSPVLIFTSAHVHIFSHNCSFSHLITLTLSFTFCHLHTFSPFCFVFLSLAFFIFLSLGGSRGSGNETPRNTNLSHEMSSIVKNEEKLRIARGRATLLHEMKFDHQTLRKIVTSKVSFARNEVGSSKTGSQSQPFCTKWSSIVKNWKQLVISHLSAQFHFAWNEVRT